jgi:hypothetical protein
MKRSVIISLVTLIVFTISAQQYYASTNTTFVAPAAKFEWTETVYDFGKISKDVPVTHKFKFTNAGDDVLVITTVKPSCGCTVTDYSKDPIPAGQEGFVKATYNAAKVGAFTKTVTINANTGGDAVVLTIKGEVVEE